MLEQLGHSSRCQYVRNGIDKATFPVPGELDVRSSGALRILVEGRQSVWFKGVRDALEATRHMELARHVTLVSADGDEVEGIEVDETVGPISQADMAGLYAKTDVVLKLSRVEGMFGPPLEGFHGGATCVVSQVTGHDEYVRHGWNGLVTDWDDPVGTARLLDLLAADRRFLHFLRFNAAHTARVWPSWDQAAQFMATALHTIRRSEEALDPIIARRVLADTRLGAEDLRRQLARPVAYPTQLAIDPSHRLAQRMRRIAKRPVLRPVVVVLRPLVRIARRVRAWRGRRRKH